MRSTITTILVLMLFSTLVLAQAPKLDKPVPVRLADGSILDVKNLGFPSAAYRDMDGDGLPDLLVGELANAALRIYKNQGTATEPVFTVFRLFKTTEGVALADPG